MIETNNLNNDSNLKEYLDYNPITGVIVWKKKRGQRSQIGSEAGGFQNQGYRRIKLQGKSMLSHRIAWYLYYGVWPEDEIDHINGVKDDNRIDNLRVVSHRENGQNQYKHRNGKLIGCYFDKRLRKNPWKAKTVINGKEKYFGMYPTEQKAYEAYKCKVAELCSEGRMLK